MKNFIYLLIYLLVTVGFFSCSKEVKPVTEQTTSPVAEPIKELKIFDESGENYVVIDVMDQRFKAFNERNITITPKFVDLTELEMPSASNSTEVLSEDDDDSPANFIVKEISLKSEFNALKFSFDRSEVAKTQGTDPFIMEYLGGCGGWESYRRVVGFLAFTEDCSHTDWEWKWREQRGFPLWDRWVKVYDEDSHGRNAPIYYWNYDIDATRYQLRVDPNDNCNTLSDWMLLTSNC